MRTLLLLGLARTVSFMAPATASPLLDFWQEYDPRREPLQVEVVRSWEDEAGHYELVRYRLGALRGSNRSASPVIAAYYGRPVAASATARVPGLVHLHGGGQRAHAGRVADWVKLGYACVSVNWGGKVLEEADTPNTDWDGLAAGFERPGVGNAEELIHHNPVRPGPHTLHREPHLMNSSWNLIAMSARRALTFLEQRPEVDPERLGVEGHSMGGRSTVLTAIDPRVKAAAPSVGGSGFLYDDLWGLPGSARRMAAGDGLELYRQVVSAQAHWPHIQAPVLFLQGANDFNAPMELVVRGLSLLPPDTPRMLAIAPHLNHRFTAETAAARFLWMEARLKGTFRFPGLSASRLDLGAGDGIPRFHVTVDESSGLPLERVEIYYGYARDPRIRFWRSATVRCDAEGRYSGACPVFDVAEPLFAFANLTYRMPKPLPARPGAAETRLLTVTSQYQIALPEALRSAGVRATEPRRRELDDFARGWQDWYRLNAENPHHWFYATRKVVDPSWMGPKGALLEIDLATTQPDNRLAVGAEVNTWQSYTGRPRDTFHAVVELPASGRQRVALSTAQFRNASGQVLGDWDEITELTFTPAERVPGGRAATGPWQGKPLQLNRLQWTGGDPAARPYPHQARAGGPSKAADFNDEFRQAIKASVVLEKMDEQLKQRAGRRVYLTRELVGEVRSFVRVNNDRAWNGEPIRVGGRSYPRGLGVHADSELRIPLDGRFAAFHVVPGPDDAHHGRLEMKIRVDDREVFSTGPTTSRSGAERRPVEIPLSGARTLTLIVDSLGERGGDHASWADAFLIPGDERSKD
jgi:dienelactone hydrolase